MIQSKVSVVIPVYKPGKELGNLLNRLGKQSYEVSEIIIINTEESYFKYDLLQNVDDKTNKLIKIFHISKEEFDHGGTRNYGASIATGDYIMFMTQDAIPKDRNLVCEFLKAFENENVYVAYARQLPRKNCDVIEKYTRDFNYPDYDIIKDENTLEEYGIKNYFCSDVCSMYRKDVFEQLGGFKEKIIFNEDMIFAHKAIGNGGKVYYASAARVIHSHNYSCIEQLKRNFDNGVSQKMNEEVFANIPSEREGVKMVIDTCKKLLTNGYFYLIPMLIIKSGCKFAGFRLGKNYNKLSKETILKLTSDKSFWSRT